MLLRHSGLDLSQSYGHFWGTGGTRMVREIDCYDVD